MDWTCTLIWTCILDGQMRHTVRWGEVFENCAAWKEKIEQGEKSNVKIHHTAGFIF